MKKKKREKKKRERGGKGEREKLGYSIIRQAEQAKIALSDAPLFTTQLNLISEMLEVDVSQVQMAEAVSTPQEKMIDLVAEAVRLGGKNPDAIYLTGGSARSPILRAAIEAQLPNIPIVSGNFFVSVTAGLTQWANTCFR